MTSYVCRHGHITNIVKSGLSLVQVQAASDCPQCKANARRRATKLANRVAKRKAGLRSGRRA